MNPVQNGLKVWIDAADIKSDATLWKDRSGNNNNFSIIGVPKIVDNIAIFDTSWRALIQNLNFTSWTIEITARFVNGENNLNHFSIGSWEQNNWKYSMGKYQISIRDKTSPSNQLLWYKISDCDNMLKTYGVTFNSNKVQIFCNGEILTTFNSTNIPDIVNFYLGYKADQGNVVADVKSLKIYNRALEDYEILNNYNYEFWDRNKKEYVNNNNLPIIVNKLMDASNIKIANNKYGNRVQTVIDKIVEKSDNVTKAINQEVINTDYSFKVGTGTNVDISSDVQDGFGKIDLKGKTYQNLNKIRNVNYNSKGDINIPIKPNTTYTIVCDIVGNTTNTPVVCALFSSVKVSETGNYNGDSLYSATVEGNKGTETKTNTPLGHNIYTYTTKSNEVWCHFRGGNQSTLNTDTKNIMLLEGDYTNDPNLPSYFEGIIGVGDKSKNLFNYKSEALYDSNHVKIEYINDGIRHIATTEVGAWPQGTVRIRLQLKPNTLYTFHREVITSPNYDPNCGNIDFREGSHTFGTYHPSVKTPFVFRTLDSGIVDFDFQAFTFANNIPTVVVEFKHIYLCEGEYDKIKYESYYGAKIEILSQNKNLFNWEDVYSQYGNEINSFVPFNGSVKKNGDTISLKLRDNSTWYEQGVSFTPIYCKVGDKLTFSGECKGDVSNITIFKYLEFDKVIADMINGFSTESWKTFSVSYVATTEGWYVARLWLRNTDLKNIQLTVNEDNENYIPPLINKTQTLLDEPLMKLSNNIYDEITEDGKLIRRVGKVVLDGTENWVLPTSTTTYYNCRVTPNAAKVPKGMCDKYNYIYYQDMDRGQTGITMVQQDTRFRREMFDNINELKTILANNPVTVYYELAEPVITDIISPSVRIFKDGHLTFNTLVAPESTHLVQLNKSAQINNTLEQVQSLNKKVDALDIIYNSLISSTSNTLSNLNK